MPKTDAQVSGRHANFLINTGDAKASDFMALIGEVRRRVAESKGVELQLEVEPWGSFDSSS